MIYVGTRTYPYGRMIMSHMFADTIGELHYAAGLMAINEKHFQNKPGRPHYDICKASKKRLLATGKAVEMNDKDIIKKLFHDKGFKRNHKIDQ